jgi:hypothetical protein
MPNAWFYYILPLGIGVLFATVGLHILRQFVRGDVDSKGNKTTRPQAFAGVLATLIGGTVALGILFTSPTPWHRQRIFDHVFRTPAEQIRRFVIKPGPPDAYRPLANTDVVIDDPMRVRQIADTLRAGREVSPNHPRTRWTAEVEMVTRDGTYYFGVSAAEPGDRNGTLVGAAAEPASGGGWNLGDVRADGLDVLLEDAVKNAARR